MEYLILFYIFIFGLIIGSFLNALIWRIRTGETMWGRSKCPKCGKQIGWYDNLPVLSFISLGGKCRHCQKAISWQYPLVELITGVLFTMSFFLNSRYINTNSEFLIFNYEFLINLIRDWFLIGVMIIIFIYDLRWYLILDKVTLPSIVILFILNLFIGVTWQNLLVSGIIGGSFFLFQFVISKGKWIGGGDIRMGALMGVALGWPKVLIALFIAYMLGSVIGLGLIAMGKKQLGSKVPFGTFLAAASLVTLFWGMQIADWYLNLFRL